MKVQRFKLGAMVVLVSLAFAPAARAQIPVTDVASLTQQIQQVMSWVQQYSQMVEQIRNQVQQISQLRETYNSMTGDRAMGGLLNGVADQTARRYLPADMAQLYDIYNGTIVPGYAALATRITGLRSTLSSLPPGYFPAGSQLETQLNKALDSLGAQRVMAQEAYKAVGDRVTNTENLMATISSATDPAAIAQLQARIQGEQVLAQNETTRIALMQYQQAAQRAEQEQRQREAFGQAQRGPIPSAAFPAAPY